MGCLPHPDDKQIAQMLKASKQTKARTKNKTCRYLNLNPIQIGGEGLFEPPLRQNRDNSYTEKAMTFKFSDFS